MFFIDSSVWIKYFRPRGSAKIKEKVRGLLEAGVVEKGTVRISQ
jgi:hypothetical protein